MNVTEAKALFAKHQIKFVLAQFVDIHGAAKAKAVPVEHLEMVLTDGAGFAGFALWGFGMGPDGPDYMAVGDLSTLTPIPWMPGYARRRRRSSTGSGGIRGSRVGCRRWRRCIGSWCVAGSCCRSRRSVRSRRGDASRRRRRTSGDELEPPPDTGTCTAHAPQGHAREDPPDCPNCTRCGSPRPGTVRTTCTPTGISRRERGCHAGAAVDGCWC